MVNLSFDEIVKIIKEKTNLSENEILNKVDAKLKELSGLVSREGAASIIANELGIKLFKEGAGKLQIKNILPGLKSVTFVAKIVKIFPIHSFKNEKREGKVASILVGDETGNLRVVFWDNSFIEKIEKGELKEGDIIKIYNGYVKESNLGGPEVHTSNRSKIEINPKDVKIDLPNNSLIVPQKKISEINEEGIFEISGTIVNFYDLKNDFFEVCPLCNKKLVEGKCNEHGEVSPKKRFMLSSVIDDGTSSIKVIFFGNQAERLMNLSNEDLLNLANQGKLKEKKDDLLGSEVIVEASFSKNDFSEEFEGIARKVYLLDPAKELSKLLQG